jgi:hypothetical protein
MFNCQAVAMRDGERRPSAVSDAVRWAALRLQWPLDVETDRVAQGDGLEEMYASQH